MIRKLTADDWADYKRLRLLSLQTDPDVYFSMLDEVRQWSDGAFRSEIYSQPESVFGYYGKFSDTGALIGYISLSRPYFAKQAHLGDLFNLYVDPAHRGRGVARSLVAHILAVAKQNGSIEKLFLSVMSQNQPAIALYESLGFTRYGLKSKSIKVGDRYIDELLMELNLV